jgi:hypothetical protein
MLPPERVHSHCGREQSAPVLDIYAHCTVCNARVKLRALSGLTETEDVIDAVLRWLLNAGNRAAADRRIKAMAADAD